MVEGRNDRSGSMGMGWLSEEALTLAGVGLCRRLMHAGCGRSSIVPGRRLWSGSVCCCGRTRGPAAAVAVAAAAGFDCCKTRYWTGHAGSVVCRLAWKLMFDKLQLLLFGSFYSSASSGLFRALPHFN